MNTKHKTPFRLSLLAAAMPWGLMQVAQAGPGWGDSTDIDGNDIKKPTFYANSPSGLRVDWKQVDPATPQGPNGEWYDANGDVVPPSIDTGKPLRKFVDTLPGLGSDKPNNLGQYLPVATPDTTTYPGSDYYEIGVVDYTEKMHSDLPKATKLRGYVQLQAGTTSYVDQPHYLGPVIVATKDRPVRIKLRNLLPAGKAGDLFLPVDPNLSGGSDGPTPTGGMKPLLLADGAGTQSVPDYLDFLQNRAELHLHGGDNPWISDGTPHQWILPAADEAALKADPATAPYARGASTVDVPDMIPGGDGTLTYYWPNGTSGRMMFYHDHTSGMTRLNVYAGEVAGYLVTDPVERALNSTLNLTEVPLIIQEKTYVPKDVNFQGNGQDEKWDTVHWGQYGDLWFPNVYETNQDPNSFDGTNPTGRWDWGPWFWPVFPSPYALADGAYPNPSTTPEAFMDTPVINGTPYPTMEVDPKAYRLRVLNGSNDRSVNLGLYVADPGRVRVDIANRGSGYTNPVIDITDGVVHVPGIATLDGSGAITEITPDYSGANDGIPVGDPQSPTAVEFSEFVNEPTVTITDADGNGNGAEAGTMFTEVKMVAFSGPNSPTATTYTCPAGGMTQTSAAYPISFPCAGGLNGTGWGGQDNRTGGIPDPRLVGPDIIHIGSEGGLTPDATVIPSTPINFEYNRRSVTVMNVFERGLYLGAAERADVIVDFSQYQGKTLILYNDAPAPVPAGDPRLDYYTDNGDNQSAGGHGSTKVGYGPNTRTMMRIKVSNTQPATELDVNSVKSAVKAAYAQTQGKPIVPQKAYNGAFPGIATTDTFASIYTGAIYLNKYNALQFTATEPLTYLQAPTCNSTASCRTALATIKAGANGGMVTAQAGQPVNAYVESKAIQELFDPNWGRMNATLGVELPFTTATIQTTIPLAYIDPATESIKDGETQFWKITHNGVDTHPVHFHLVNVQVINRVGWDGTKKPPFADEIGWKETVKMNPLEDIIVAVRAKAPALPFGVPNSARALDPSQPLVDPVSHMPLTLGFTQINPATGNPATVANLIDNFDWEYVWHCHILGHEENDFMRPVKFNFASVNGIAVADPTTLKPNAPTNVALNGKVLGWTDPTPAGDPATLGNKQNEIGFRVERATVTAGTTGAFAVINPIATVNKGANAAQTEIVKTQVSTPANATTLTDATQPAGGGATVSAPSVTASATGASVTLNWAAVAGQGYTVLRSATGAPGSFTQVGTTSTGSFTQNGLTANTTYYYQVQAAGSGSAYRVVALNAYGESSSATVFAGGNATSATVTAKTQATVLAAVSNLAGSLSAANQVALTFTNRSTGQAGYQVQVATNAAGTNWSVVTTGVSLATSGTAMTATVNMTLVRGTNYRFRVVPYATAPASAATVLITPVSNSASVSLAAAPTAPASLAGTSAAGAPVEIRLAWADRSNNNTTFEIQRCQGTTTTCTAVVGTWTNVSTAVAANATAYTVTGLTANQNFRFRIRATNAFGSSGWTLTTNVITFR